MQQSHCSDDEFIEFIFNNWKGTKKDAKKFVKQMKDSEFTVKQMLQEFKDEYSINNPIRHENVWEYLCMLKLESTYGDYKDYGKSMWDLVTNGSLLPEQQQTEIYHAEDMPFEIQAALCSNITVGNFMENEQVFDRVIERYPNVEELPVIKIAIYMHHKELYKMKDAVEIVEKRYPDNFEIMNMCLSVYEKIEDMDGVERIANSAKKYFRSKQTIIGWRLVLKVAYILKAHARFSKAMDLLQTIILNPGKMQVEKHCDEMHGAYACILSLPIEIMENNVALVLIKYILFIKKLKAKNLDLDKPPLADFIGNIVIGVSENLYCAKYREPFRNMLDCLSQIGVLRGDGYQQIIPSGYQSLESYLFDENFSCSDEMHELFAILYDGPEYMDDFEKIRLRDYLDSNPKIREKIRLQYPYLGKKVKQFMRMPKMPKNNEIPAIFSQEKVIPERRIEKKIGRNDPCPCGSGLKYKKCCGK